MNCKINFPVMYPRKGRCSMDIPMSETAFQSALGKLRQGHQFSQAFRALRVAQRERVFELLMGTAPKGLRIHP